MLVCGYTFSECYNLETARFPALQRLPENTFYYIDNLKTVYLNNCSEIASYAFGGCDNLRSIYLGYSSVCSVDEYGFGYDYEFPSNLTIYVPASLVSSYQTAQYWSNFYQNYGLTISAM